MALIRCPKCGKEISDKAKRCIHCGNVITGNLKFPAEEKQSVYNTILCPECGKEISDNEEECPHCGCPLGAGAPVSGSTQKTASHKKLMWTAAAGILVVGVLAVILNISKSKPRDLDEKVEGHEETESALESSDMDLQSEKEEIENVVNDFLANLQQGNLEATQGYLTEKYDYLDHNPFGLSSESNLGKLFEKYQYTLVDSTVNDEKDTAFIDVDVRHPKQNQLLDAGIANFNLNDEDSIENGFMNKLDDSDLEYEVTGGSLNLVMVNGEWRIEVDSFFDSCIFYGLSEESSFEKMAENKKKRAEEELYIKEMIELIDYRIEIMDGYSGKVPGISNISIKNNGEKQIDSLVLDIIFPDENGDTKLSKEITILGMFDNPISAGYSWKMEKDKFFEIENLPDDIDLDNAIATVKSAQLSEVKETAKNSPEEEYIEQFIEITNYHVGMQSGFGGKEPGLSDVSIKNNGERDIAELVITIYFQDEDGKNIAEDSFMLIGGLWGGDTLKANYSWKMDGGGYYEFKYLADEVELSRNTAKVTEIKFE